MKQDGLRSDHINTEMFCHRHVRQRHKIEKILGEEHFSSGVLVDGEQVF